MAKEKNASDKPTAKKTAAKKSPGKNATAKQPVAEQVAAVAAVASTQPPTAPVQKAQPSHAEMYEEIRRRAYELYRQRGGQHGSHEADWHRAEAEIRAKYKA
ncbi:MAG: DUF2934 domain-containing protein [Candidatus Korobacteraceae bacterium]|jgi:hypothetical protein